MCVYMALRQGLLAVTSLLVVYPALAQPNEFTTS